jgi:hypothetical protein
LVHYGTFGGDVVEYPPSGPVRQVKRIEDGLFLAHRADLRSEDDTLPILAKGTCPAPGFVDIRRATRKQYSADEKIRIVLEGLRGKDSIGGLAAAFVRRRAKAEDKAT